LLSAVVPIAEVVKVAGVVGKVVQGADKFVEVAKGVNEVGDAIHTLDAAESAAVNPEPLFHF
jgi:preprotein translocase subunit YajC